MMLIQSPCKTILHTLIISIYLLKKETNNETKNVTLFSSSTMLFVNSNTIAPNIYSTYKTSTFPSVSSLYLQFFSQRNSFPIGMIFYVFCTITAQFFLNILKTFRDTYERRLPRYSIPTLVYITVFIQFLESFYTIYFLQ